MRRNGPVKSYQLNQDQVQRLCNNELSLKELDSCLVRKTRVVTLHDLDDMVKRYGHKYCYASWFGLNAETFSAVMIETGEILFHQSYLTLKYIRDFLGFQMIKGRVVLFVQ